MQAQKKNVTQTYSIISAVYNVAPYLDDYFKSLTKQTLDFKKHIYLILVDDGSTDNSAEIIQAWQQKYPDNIQYIKKENGGQSSARNLGLQHLTTPWVTFIDPDDFIHKNYFKEVDNTISNHPENDLALVSCHIQYYFEQYKLYLNRHPLKTCFKDTDSPSIIHALTEQIQLSASTAIFKTELIDNLDLKFDTNIKPNFEDSHFVNSYLIAYADKSIFFLKSAIYYYRRRKSKNSTIDTAWTKKELFDDVLRLGCRDLFMQAKQKYGFVPVFVQRAVLYHLAWYYRNLMNHNEQIAFLSKEEQATFHILLKELFQEIDVKTIENFDFANISFFEKYAWSKCYKKMPLDYQTVFIIKSKEYLIISYYADNQEDIEINIDNVPVTPIVKLKQAHSFVNSLFINEYYTKIPIKSQDTFIHIQINKQTTYLHSGKVEAKNILKISEIQSDIVKRGKQTLHNIARKLLLG